MTKVGVSAAAKRDVRIILSDLGVRAGYLVAARYAEQFKSAYRTLSEFPGSGAPRPLLGANTRIKIVSPYVIVYDHVRDTVVVLRVLHGRRNIAAELIKD